MIEVIEKSVSATASSVKKWKGKLVVSAYFLRYLQLSHGSGKFINLQESSRKLRLLNLEPKVEAKDKPRVIAEENVVSCYIKKQRRWRWRCDDYNQQWQQGEDKAKAQNKKKVVSPLFPALKQWHCSGKQGKKQVFTNLQPQQDQSPSPVKKQVDNSSLRIMSRASCKDPHKKKSINDTYVSEISR